MPTATKLDNARNNNFLWPTIADAVETFVKRRDSDADSYERIWRLIHVWEATAITLAVAAMTRYQSIPDNVDVLRKCREYYYGMSWDQVNKDFKTSQGASDGSIDQWMNILETVSKDENKESNFLNALREFLNEGEIDLRSLAQAWNRACDVPQM